MTIKPHNGSFVAGDIVGYGITSLSGYKLLKLVYIEEISESRWIGKAASVDSNGVVSDRFDGRMKLLEPDDINDSFPNVYKPFTFKSGDVLVGLDKGETMLFVYISDTHVERLTARTDYDVGRFGYSSLDDYERNFGPLTVQKMKHPYAPGDGRFSAL